MAGYYDRGRRAYFYVSQHYEVEGSVHDMFNYDGVTYYVLRYEAGEEPAFVVRRIGQFRFG